MGGQPPSAARAVLLAAGWLAGVALQLQQPVLWDTAPNATLAVAAAAVLLAAWRWRARLAVAVLMAAAVAALAFASTTERARAVLADRLAPALEGEDLLVTGVVAELPRSGPTGTRFVLETESALRRGTPVALPTRLSLGWYRNADDDGPLSGPSEELRAGRNNFPPNKSEGRPGFRGLGVEIMLPNPHASCDLTRHCFASPRRCAVSSPASTPGPR